MLTSTAAALGVMLFPFEEVHASPVFGAVSKFADAVGADVLADLISEYLQRGDVSNSFAREIRETNQEMADNGNFSDLRGSTVYTPEGGYIFYPARKSTDGFNACAAFLDRNRNPGSRQIALIEGPTLFGVGELAARIARNQPTHVVRKTLLPRRNINSAGVSMRRSYSSPDVYQSRDAKVTALYKTNGKGQGTVRVEARNESGSLLAGGDYDLTYHTAE